MLLTGQRCRRPAMRLCSFIRVTAAAGPRVRDDMVTYRTRCRRQVSPGSVGSIRYGGCVQGLLASVGPAMTPDLATPSSAERQVDGHRRPQERAAHLSDGGACQHHAMLQPRHPVGDSAASRQPPPRRTMHKFPASSLRLDTNREELPCGTSTQAANSSARS